MRMAHHQFALVERRQLGPRRRRERGVPRCCEFIHVHAAEERGARVPHYAAVHLRPELLRRKEHEPEIAAALRDIEEHFPHIRVGPVGRGVLVEFVNKHNHMIHAERAFLEVLTELRDDARKNQVLRVLFEIRNVHHVHAAIVERAPWEIAHRPVVGHETAAARRDVRQAIPNLPDRGDVMRAPLLLVLFFHRAQQIAEPAFKVRERLHAVRRGTERGVLEILVHHAFTDEIDERIGLCVHVVLVEQHLGVLQHLAQAPGERTHVMRQRLVGTQRVERVALRRVWREVLHVGKRLGGHSQLGVELEI